jgi:acyl transferase domain-containing protein/NADP-dependent 3-hydroxy acid dehydrogenase YdfG
VASPLAAHRSPLAIVGIGCLFPKADGPGAYWANIKNKIDCIGPVPPTHWNPDEYFDADPKRSDFTYARRGGFLEPVPFNPAEWGIAPNDLEATDTSQLLALVAAQMALRDANLLINPSATSSGLKCDKRRISVILGVTGTLELVVPLGARLGHPIWRKALKDAGVSDNIAEEVVRRIGEGYVPWQENSFPGLLGNVVAGRVANRLDLGGTNCVVDAACASSLSAVHLAGLELQTGRADVVVTGGVDTFNDIFMYMCFSKTPALSPTGDAKPFDSSGDGTILGEGLGIVVLKRLADAERDGDRVYAVIKGMGTSSDGKGNAVYAPSPSGQVEALRSAYEQAGVTPDTIELIEAHGTGTRVGDAAEVEALKRVFSDASRKRSWCALGSVKSQLGHTKAAAGAAGLIKAALALYHKVLPPTIKVSNPLANLDGSPFYVNTEPRPWLPRDGHPRRAGVSAFGFGGSNFHCVLEEHSCTKPLPDWDGDVQIVALSGADQAEIERQLSEVDESIETNHGGGWAASRARAAISRAAFDPTASHRLTIVLCREKDPATIIARARELLVANAGRSSWEAPDGIAYGSGPPGRLGFLFPGQGAQSVGMLRDLACTFQVTQAVLAEADHAFAANLVVPGRRLSDFIYPPPAFTPEARAEQEDALRATTVAQPALGAVSLGALQVLAHFEIKPHATAGHSYGELTALCAAGCFDAPSLFELSQLRGRLMADSGQDDDAGAMLAVQAPLEIVEEFLAAEKYNLVVANKNGPAQAVLSGRTAEIERAAATLKERRVRHVRLPVAAAFHSPLVASSAGPFRAALEPIAFHTAQLPVFANSTAREYPRDPQAVRDLLAGQLARPVEFVDQIRNMAAAGVTTFVEVGPGSTLTRLVDSILDGTPHHAVAIDASAGKRPGMLDLAHTLARLAALGHPMRLTAWDENAPPLPPVADKPTMTVPICGANYRKKNAPKPLTSIPWGEGGELAKTSTPSPTRERGSAGLGGAAVPAPRTQPITEQPMANDSYSDALRVTRESLAAFQRMQEQTAQLHKQFLETQESAQRTLQVLVEGQQRLLAASLGLPIKSPPSLPPANATAAPPPARQPAMNTPLPMINKETVPPPAPPASTSRVQEAPSGVSASLSADRVRQILIAVVAEKTGYPPDMLDLDMGLDADLGIDSIKRVEILSALQEQLPDAPSVKPEHLGTLLTLQEIVTFLCNGEPAGYPALPDGSAAGALPRRQEHPTSAAAGSPGIDGVLQAIVAIVAEKTGYPTDMIDPDMGLDADLGIDSIKRVEILSAVQEQLPDAPVVKPEHLGTLQTLRQIADFLCSSEQLDGAVAHGNRVAATQAAHVGGPPTLDRRVLRAVPLTGDRRAVTIASAADIWLVGAGPLTAAVAERLSRRGLQVTRFGWADPPSSPPAALGGLVLIAPTDDGSIALNAFRWLRQTGPALRQSASAFVATVTRLDGKFGLSTEGPHGVAETGALAGLAKTAGQEWSTVEAKAVDISPLLDTAAAAEAIVEELFLAGPAEIGLAMDGRHGLELVAAPMDSASEIQIGLTDVIVLTGGARGVTAEVAVALSAGRSTLVLLGRSPAPTAESPGLAACYDEMAIKRHLATSMLGATPRQIAVRCQEILAAREVSQTLNRIKSTGAKVTYRSVDVRDVAAVAKTFADVRRTAGPITGVVHGAGVLADRRIDDQTDEQFDAVYSTKVAGLSSILAATAGDPLRFLAVFSSSTGRFGRAGQVAYAAANEAVNKIAQAERRRRPRCRVAAVNWGPWEGGMVTPALRGVFQAEGIGLIPLSDGARHLLAELATADGPVETVVLGAGSVLPGDRSVTPHGTDERAAPPVAFERSLSLDSHPVLAAHVIDGRAVLPMALTIEWLTHAALHGNPGLTFHGLDNLHIYHPVTVRNDGDTPIRVHAGKALRQDGQSRVAAEVRGTRADGREVVHSRAEIVLAGDLPAPPAAAELPTFPPYRLDPDDVYQHVLFHGPELRGIEKIAGCGPTGIVVTADSSPAPAAWLRQPLRGKWLADPLALDCAFQAMSLWCHAERGAVSLPSAVRRYRQYVRRFPTGPVTIVCLVEPGAGPIIRAQIEFISAGKVVARIDGFECVLDPKLNAAFRRNRLVRV